VFLPTGNKYYTNGTACFQQCEHPRGTMFKHPTTDGPHVMVTPILASPEL